MFLGQIETPEILIKFHLKNLDRLSTTPRICRYLKLFGGVAITFYAIEREEFCKCEFEHCFFRQSKWAVLHCA